MRRGIDVRHATRREILRKQMELLAEGVIEAEQALRKLQRNSSDQ